MRLFDRASSKAAEKGIGAEGGLNSNTLFLAFLLGIFDFLRKTAISGFRTVRTVSTVSTQLYLSCSCHSRRLDQQFSREILRTIYLSIVLSTTALT